MYNCSNGLATAFLVQEPQVRKESLALLSSNGQICVGDRVYFNTTSLRVYKSNANLGQDAKARWRILTICTEQFLKKLFTWG
mmetsp:Transcript_14213/g.18955  ORF Transcript_14213/g.18955 Transcript_14213/m.18955 type:complete len:82 (-) Transcript_14213:144-389(-)